MFSLRDLRFLFYSLELNILDAQRIMGFFNLDYPQINEVRQFDHMNDIRSLFYRHQAILCCEVLYRYYTPARENELILFDTRCYCHVTSPKKLSRHLLSRINRHSPTVFTVSLLKAQTKPIPLLNLQLGLLTPSLRRMQLTTMSLVSIRRSHGRWTYFSLWLFCNIKTHCWASQVLYWQT